MLDFSLHIDATESLGNIRGRSLSVRSIDQLADLMERYL